MARWRKRPETEIPAWVLDPRTPGDRPQAWLDGRFEPGTDEWWEAFTVLLSTPGYADG